MAFEGHWGRKMAEGQSRAGGTILGRWRIEGTEPCKICEEGEGSMGSRNLLENRKERNVEQRRFTLFHDNNIIFQFKSSFYF